MADRSLVITSRAVRQLNLIKDYILQKWGITGLENFQRRLFEALNYIKTHPGTCQVWPHSKDTHKTLVYRRTLILFQFGDDLVRVTGFYDARVNPNKIQSGT